MLPSSDRAFAGLALAIVTAAGCSAHDVSAPGTAADITVTSNTTLAAGATQQMVAVGHDAEGRIVPISPNWSVVAKGGTITPAGVFVAGTVTGVFPNTVVASLGLISGSASIVVTPGALATISVAPAALTMAVGARQQFVAIASDANGNIVQFTPTWSVVAGGGTIDSLGNFTAGGAPGTYAGTVQASNNGIKSFATVVVTTGPLVSIVVTPGTDTLIAGGTHQFVAVGKDVAGNSIPIASAWTVVAGGGTVDGGGNFTAGPTTGVFAGTVQATSGSLSATASVVITVGPLATITVTPNPSVMVVGSTRQFTATGKDAAGNDVAITPSWAVVTVSNGASITATGLYTAGSVVGTFPNKVRATSGGISGYATIVATIGALAKIAVTPNPVSVQANGTQQFVAVGTDAGGNVFLIAPLWSVVNGGGSINAATGVFTASAAPGTFAGTVQATSGGVAGTATVTVTSAPVVGVVSTFENFALGAVDGQQDWQSFGGIGAPPPANPLNTHCAVYDHVIVDNTAAAGAYSYPVIGNKSLRISNAVTSGCYSDQTFSSRTANPAGQAGARSTSKDGLTNFALPGGALQNHFEAEWSFASTQPNAQQPGLQVVASPARGDDLRMGWVQMSDLSDGLAVVFGEWTSTLPGGTALTGAPMLTTVAHGLDRHVPHTIKISINFVDGPNNDVVQLFVDSVLVHAGTTWENYYSYQAGGLALFGGAPPIVNRLMFRTGSDLARAIPGLAAPATLGHGFVIDNLRQATFMVPAVASSTRRKSPPSP